MNKILLNICLNATLAFLFIGASAQAPQQINYQAVARSASGSVLANQAVGLRFTIHDASASGATVYQETFSGISTNQFGLFTVAIGSGTQVGNNTFAAIQWGMNSKYLEVEIDATGGTNYTISGTTQLNAVPYALYAANAPAGQAGATGATGPSGASGATGLTGPTGILPSGATAGNTPYWNGTSWVTNSSNLYNNGANIGIHTSTPMASLEVDGNGLNTLFKGNQPYIGLKDTSSGSPRTYDSYMWQTAGGLYIGSYGNAGSGGPIAFNTNGTFTPATATMTLLQNGNVGIGTATPLAKLDIENDTISPALKLVDGTQAAGKVLTSDSSGNASWKAAGTGIYFLAHSDTNTVLPGSTFTQIPFQIILANDGGGFNNTNNTYTVPSSGLYHFDINLVETGGGGYLYLVVNGNFMAATVANLGNTAQTQPMVLSSTLKLNTGDVLSVTVISLGANHLIANFNGGGNFWSGYKVY